MKSLGMIVFLAMVLILPLSVQAQPPENPPPSGPINELREQIQDLQDQINNIQTIGLDDIYYKHCENERICECDSPNDIVIAVAGDCYNFYQIQNTIIRAEPRDLSECTPEDVGTQWPVSIVGRAVCTDASTGEDTEETSGLAFRTYVTCLKGAGPFTCEVSSYNFEFGWCEIFNCDAQDLKGSE